MRVKVATAATCGVAIVLGAVLWTSNRSVPVAPLATLTMPSEFLPVAVTDPQIAVPKAANGWPLALPGSITGTPAVADLEGDGKLCVIVPCEKLSDATLLHPKPVMSAMLYAFHADGSPVRNFPVTLVTSAERQGGENSGRVEWWTSCPSVCKDAHGTHIVLTTPYFLGYRVVSADGRVKKLHGGSQWSSPPLVDIDGDGICDIISGAGIYNIDGGPVRGFDARHSMVRMSGFAPCIGDANGDGKIEVFHLFADKREKLKTPFGGYNNPRMDVMGFDASGQPIAGWPREIGKRDLMAYPPVMGDITGDGKMEIVAADQEAIYAWTPDGKGVTSDDGVLVKGIQPVNGSPTLADLDGDGKAEVIIFDEGMFAIRAWHGDGKPVVGTDGVIAKLTYPVSGVSVADLDGDGIMDLFAGTYWIKFNPKTGQSTVTNMLGADHEMAGTQPTICDLYGDGNAEAIFGLKNGALVVYQTGAKLKPQWLQWPTAYANFQHTGCWTSPGAQRNR